MRYVENWWITTEGQLTWKREDQPEVFIVPKPDLAQLGQALGKVNRVQNVLDGIPEARKTLGVKKLIADIEEALRDSE